MLGHFEKTCWILILQMCGFKSLVQDHSGTLWKNIGEARPFLPLSTAQTIEPSSRLAVGNWRARGLSQMTDNLKTILWVECWVGEYKMGLSFKIISNFPLLHSTKNLIPACLCLCYVPSWLAWVRCWCHRLVSLAKVFLPSWITLPELQNHLILPCAVLVKNWENLSLWMLSDATYSVLLY